MIVKNLNELDKIFEDESSVENLMSTNESGNVVRTVKLTVPKMYSGFADKTLQVMNALAQNKRFFYGYKIGLKGTEVFVAVVKNKDGSSQLFEPLRRLGILVTELTIGISEDDKHLYISNKVLKIISKFSTSMITELTAYLMCIAHLIRGLAYEVPELSTVYGTALQASVTDWATYIYSFNKPDIEIEVSEIPTCPLEYITYISNKYSTPCASLIGAYPDNSCVICNTDKSVPFLLISKDIDKDTMWGVYVSSKSDTIKVVTNEELSYMNMDYDSFIAAIVHATGRSVSVQHTDNFKSALKIKSEVTINTELEDTSTNVGKLFNNIITTYNSNMGMLKAKLGMCFDKYKMSGICIDIDAIKESYKDDSFAQQLYKQVHEYYDTFDLKELSNTVKGFATGDIYSMMFIGESGTGKSTAARVIPYRCGFPYISVNFCVNIEESDLIGSMIPNPEKSKPEDPEFIWQDGLLTKAIRNGYTAVLEEINFARPGVLGKLNSLLDENRQIDLPNGEIVKAHPNFRMIATCNISYEGTNRFNKALINRFEVVHEFKDLEKLKAFEVIKSRTKVTDEGKLSKVYTVYELLKKFSKEQNLDTVISIRQLLNLFRQGRYYATAYDAIVDILINGAFIELPEYKERFLDTFSTMKKEYMFKL